MLDVTDSDIQQLNDADLRELVARLCRAELRRASLPASAVTAGGHQDAPDGGLDVRVELSADASIRGYIPRPVTGFQGKRSDMRPSAIRTEMRPHGRLRTVIRDLAVAKGAYIIVSSHGSTSDSALARRRSAMRDAIDDTDPCGFLHVDFYDLHRLASWVEEHPGTGLWVRERVGRRLRGWRPYANWSAPAQSPEAAYIVDATSRLHDFASGGSPGRSVLDGIARMRHLLSEPRAAVRLLGVSGTGKTRLVEALFDHRIGDNALDPALAVYTDLGEQPEPSPRDLVHSLIANRRRAVVIVDNCPPQTHSTLAQVSLAEDSLISLITVEYDIADDDPEGTQVFKLDPASDEVIAQLIEQRYATISQINRDRIADFCDGNARVALALAHTVSRGESLATLSDRDLLERIVHQRNARDDSVLHVAEICSLVYSFDGTLEGDHPELPHLARLCELSPLQFHRKVRQLEARDLIQRRGRWRALLPQAVANRLAHWALERLPRGIVLETMLSAPPRFLRSFTRRLGYLHDNEVAKHIVTGWLSSGRLLGDVTALSDARTILFQNVAPVCPEAALTAIERGLNGGRRDILLAHPSRRIWISLLRLLAYDRLTFQRAALALADFLMAAPAVARYDSAEDTFKSLFHLYLSGTHAPPSERLAVADMLLSSAEESRVHCGRLALDAMTEAWNFRSFGGFEFGSRPRDFGWQPRSRTDIEAWYAPVLTKIREMAQLSEHFRRWAMELLADRFRALWVRAGMVDQLEEIMKEIGGEAFWVDAWLAVRQTLRFDGGSMSPEARSRLERLEGTLRPTHPRDVVRGYVLPQQWQLVDAEAGPEDDANPETASSKYARLSAKARALGYEVASKLDVLESVLPELTRGQVGQGKSFGSGLAEGASDPVAMWARLRNAVAAAPPAEWNVGVLRGFLHALAERDASAVESLLDDAVHDPVLGAHLPLLQAAVKIDQRGTERLMRALANGLAPIDAYRHLAYGRTVDEVPAKDLRGLLDVIASMPSGHSVAIEILAMRLHSAEGQLDMPIDSELVQCGQALLRQVIFREGVRDREYDLAIIAKHCLSAPGGEECARTLCRAIRRAISKYHVHVHDIDSLLKTLFESQPFVALDEFLGDNMNTIDTLCLDDDDRDRSPLKGVPEQMLLEWARSKPENRFHRLALCMGLFEGEKEGDLALSTLALRILDEANQRETVLQAFQACLVPMGWTGSLADILYSRAEALGGLTAYPDALVSAWAEQQIATLQSKAAKEREWEKRSDESFE